jgi:4-amino-4-deoxy-L-arabinose transferase-like glycosyltransferase
VTDRTRISWRDPVLLSILAASLAIKLGFVYLANEIGLLGDEKEYLALGRFMANGKGFITNFRPPLYPAFIGAGLKLFDSAVAIRALQALLSGASIPLVYGIASRVGGQQTARTAAALFAFDPILIGFSHLLWSETLFITLFLAGIHLLLRDPAPVRPAGWFAAGICFGLGGLTRSMLLTLMPLLLPWLLLWVRRQESPDWKKAALCFAMLTIGTCTVILPWSIHNLRAWESFFLVDTNGPYNILIASDPTAHRVDFNNNWDTRWGRIGRTPYLLEVRKNASAAQQRALQMARENVAREPLRYLGGSLWQAWHLWTLDNFNLRHLRMKKYPDVSGGWIAVTTIVMSGATILLFGLGALGLVSMPPSPLRGFVTLALAHTTLLYGVLFSLSRYSAPLRPLLAICAAYLLTHPVLVRQRFRGKGSTGRRWVAGMLGIFLLTCWAHDLPLLSNMVTHAGADYQVRNLKHQ